MTRAIFLGHTDVAGLPGGGSRGFLLRQGNFIDVNYPGHLNTIPVKITNGGQIVDCYHDTDTMGTMHGFVLNDGNFSDLMMPASMNNGVSPDGGAFAPFDFPFSFRLRSGI